MSHTRIKETNHFGMWNENGYNNTSTLGNWYARVGFFEQVVKTKYNYLET